MSGCAFLVDRCELWDVQTRDFVKCRSPRSSRRHFGFALEGLTIFGFATHYPVGLPSRNLIVFLQYI